VAEVERLAGVYLRHPLAGSADKKSFALAIADNPDRWALFMIRDKGPEGARAAMLRKVRMSREKLLRDAGEAEAEGIIV
jgi:hypothetical protein